jgi:hypothetical protein
VGHHRREEERLREAALELVVEVSGGGARGLALAARRREEAAARGIAAVLVHGDGARALRPEPRGGFRRGEWTEESRRRGGTARAVGTGKEGRERCKRAQKQNVKRAAVRKMESGVRVGGGESRLAFVFCCYCPLGFTVRWASKRAHCVCFFVLVPWIFMNFLFIIIWSF